MKTTDKKISALRQRLIDVLFIQYHPEENRYNPHNSYFIIQFESRPRSFVPRCLSDICLNNHECFLWDLVLADLRQTLTTAAIFYGLCFEY